MRCPHTEELWKKRKNIPKNRTIIGSTGTPLNSAYLFPTWNIEEENKAKYYLICKSFKNEYIYPQHFINNMLTWVRYVHFALHIGAAPIPTTIAPGMIV